MLLRNFPSRYIHVIGKNDGDWGLSHQIFLTALTMPKSSLSLPSILLSANGNVTELTKPSRCERKYTLGRVVGPLHPPDNATSRFITASKKETCSLAPGGRLAFKSGRQKGTLVYLSSMKYAHLSLCSMIKHSFNDC